MVDDVSPQVAQLISDRRDAVALAAIAELQQASPRELPALTHRLAGKLGVFGYSAAGELTRQLMLDLKARPETVASSSARVAEIVSLLHVESGGHS